MRNRPRLLGLLSTLAENSTKSFSYGHQDTLVLGDILLRKKLLKRIIS